MQGYADRQLATEQTAHVDSFSLPSVNYPRSKSIKTTRVVTRPFSNISTNASAEFFPRDISSRFGLRLRELRRAHNMTQLRMAVDFGIDRSFISDVERGRKSISLHMLEVIALGLKVSLSDLLDGI
jgi:DNA-binding XRE family transcriptional regulator